MALSVSAFPEHIQARHSNDVFSTGDDGNTRNVVNAPRILGFFGGVGSGASGKKPESSLPRLGARDDEPDGLGSPGVNPSTSTPPQSSTFQFSPPHEYEMNLEFEDQGVAPWAQSSSRRHQPSPFARKTTPSPMRLSASSVSNRLEIATATRTPPFPTHAPSKSVPPPAHTMQPWSPNEASSSTPGHVGHAHSSTRPLPIVPNSGSESFKPGSSSPPGSGSLGSLKPATSIILPSRSASVITGSSKHTNALPTSPNYSSNLAGPMRQSGIASRKASLSSTASPITPPSKVLITQPQRGHNANSASVSMRYQSLVVDQQPSDTSLPASSSPKQSNDSTIIAPSAIRPLPRVPPASSVVINSGLSSSGIITNSSNSMSLVRPTRRPRTSPGSFSGFSGLTNSGVDPRSAFENIPSSWASKPSGLSSSRPSSPPSKSAALMRTTTTTTMHPRRLPSPKMPRARSLSRPRRERSSLDSNSRLQAGTPRTPPSSVASFALSGGVGRSLTVGRYSSQPLTGACALTKSSTTIMGRQQDSIAAGDVSAGSALGKRSSPQINAPPPSSLSRNPSLRHVRPQPPSGPVLRTKSVRPTPATKAGTSSPRFDSPKAASQSPSMPKALTSTDSINDTAFPESSSMDLHIHPVIPSLGNDDLSVSTASPADSPLEFFVDGPETELPFSSRSPSPICYALPPDNGELSDWNSTNDEETTDDDLGGVSSSTSNSRGFAVGRRRTQLRSYRMNYGPQLQDRLVHDSDWKRGLGYSPLDGDDATIQALPKPARALPVPPRSIPREKKKGKEEKKKKEKWSFGDFTSMGSLSSPSTPATRASSPERKGRSRQPRRLAEAVSLALGSGSRDIAASRSSSGRGSVSAPSHPPLFAGLSTYTSHQTGVRPRGADASAEYEVLDIRMPSFEGKEEPRNNTKSLPVPLDFRIHEFSSTFRTDSDSPDTPTTLVKRTPVAQDRPRGGYTSESSRSDVHWVTKEGKRSGLRDPTLVESRIIFRNPSDDDYESEDIPFMWLSKDKPPDDPPFIPLPPLRGHGGTLSDDQQPEEGERSDLAPSLKHKIPSPELFPAMVSSVSAVGYAPLPPLSTLLVYPTKRGSQNEKVGRKQRTTSGPSRFNLTGGSSGSQNVSSIEPATPTVDSSANLDSTNVQTEADDDDIYCDEEPSQKPEVEKDSVVVIT